MTARDAILGGKLGKEISLAEKRLKSIYNIR